MIKNYIMGTRKKMNRDLRNYDSEKISKSNQIKISDIGIFISI